MRTMPEVFIIESLLQDDHQEGRCEGDLISRILTMGGRKPIYRYTETRQAFKDAIQEFGNSEYRYLHISSHGAEDHFLFQFGEIYFTEFNGLIKPILNDRRVFISACEAVNHKNHELANAVLRDTGCYSLIGSAEEINFDAAAIFWANFYYLAYKDQGEDESVTIKRDLIRTLLRALTGLYRLKLNYYFSEGNEIRLERFVNGRRRIL